MQVGKSEPRARNGLDGASDAVGVFRRLSMSMMLAAISEFHLMFELV